MRQYFRKLIRSIAKDRAYGRAQFIISMPEMALRSELQRRAMIRAADIVENDMHDALYCNDRLTLLEYAISQKPNGITLEFGVYKGTTINAIAGLLPSETIYGFDTFEGLPGEWTGNRYSARNFNRDARPPKVKKNVELVIGLFCDTLPNFIKTHGNPIGFVHIDCDIYTSTKEVLDLIGERLKPGTIIVFDEYFNYPGFEQHEYKAFHEFIDGSDFSCDFLAYSGQQVAVRLK